MPRLADEMGILLWEEVPVYWTIDWTNEATLSNAQNQLKELIARDKNRSSVIIWSVANETPVSEARNEFLKKMVNTARESDDTRFVSAALEVHTEGKTKIMDDPFGAFTDIVSFNQYHVTRTSNSQSLFSLEAITECTLAEIDASKFETLIEVNLEIREFANTILRNELLQKINKEIRLISWTGKERLEQFRRDYKMLENLVPHSMIATYLGITNVSLSRLRKNS